MDDTIDNIFDLFDRAMYYKDHIGMAFGFKLIQSMITELDTDIIIAILSISLPLVSDLQRYCSLDAREEFARAATIVIAHREPDDAPDILRGLT